MPPELHPRDKTTTDDTMDTSSSSDSSDSEDNSLAPPKLGTVSNKMLIITKVTMILKKCNTGCWGSSYNLNFLVHPYGVAFLNL